MAEKASYLVTKHPDYTIWKKMRSRCNSPTNDDYQWYGAKGVKVCERWDSFSLFIQDMGPRPSKDYTIDRIDPEKGYSPENCRWATRLEQQRSKRHHWRVEVDGKQMMAVDYARMMGLNPDTIYSKLIHNPPKNVKVITAGSRHAAIDFTALRDKLLKQNETRVPSTRPAPGIHDGSKTVSKEGLSE